MPQRVVTGGAGGADKLGQKWAETNKIPVTLFTPDWNRFGKAAGIIRNQDIVDAADVILAFPSHSGKGTQNSIARAKIAKKPVIEIWMD